MATPNPTLDRNSLNGALLVSWPLGDADTGLPFAIPFSADITVQVAGTFGSSTVVLEGSNDGTNWVTLGAVVGTNTSFTSAGIRKAAEAPAFIRAKSSGGTSAATVVTVAVKAIFEKVSY